MPGRLELIAERRAARTLRLGREQWRGYTAIVEWLTDADHRLKACDEPMNWRTEQVMYEALAALERPLLDPDLDGMPADSSVHKKLNELASVVEDRAQRRRASLPDLAIGSGAPVRSIQRFFMARVRVLVRTTIQAALAERIAPVIWAGRQLRDDTAAFHLAAAFIRAFYPVWGATTSHRTVEKAR